VYNSSITGLQEVLPVATDVMVAKECDGVSFQLAKALAAAGILKMSLPGRTLEEGGEVLFEREARMVFEQALKIRIQGIEAVMQ